MSSFFTPHYCTVKQELTGGGGDGGVKGIDVEAEVDGAGAAGGDVLDGHLDDLGNAVLVDLVHGEGLDAVLTEDLLLTSVDVTETDVDETVRGEAGLDPGKLLDLAGDSEQERDGAAVNVSTLGRLGGVDILMVMVMNTRTRTETSDF